MEPLQFRDEAHWRAVGTAMKNGDLTFDSPEEDTLVRESLVRFGDQLNAQKTEAFKSRVDFTPTGEVPEDRPARVIPGRVPTNLPESSQANPDERIHFGNAASAGVDVQTGAPASIRAKANLLNLSEKAGVLALDHMLRRQYADEGIEIPDGVEILATDGFTGQLAYLRPTEDGRLKPTLVNPQGFDGGDMLQGLDEVAGVAVEGLAAFGGAAGAGTLTGGNPVAAAAGGSAAGGAANAATNKARHELARAFGIPDEIVDTITSDEMLTEAAMASVGEAGGAALGGAMRWWKNRGRPLRNETDVEAFKAEMADLFQKRDKVKELSGEEVLLDMSAASGQPELTVLAAQGRRDLKNKDSMRVRTAEVEYRMSTASALKGMAEGTVEKHGVPLNVPSAQLGELAQATVKAPHKEALRILDGREKALEDVLEDAANLSHRTPFKEVQTSLHDAALSAKADADAQWQAFRELTGFNEKTQKSSILLANGQGSRIKQALKQLDAEAQQALSQSYARSKESLGVDLLPLTDNALDFIQLHDVLSHLKATSRRQAATNDVQFDNKSIRNLVGAIQEQVDNGPIINREGLRFRDGGKFSGPEGKIVPGTRSDLSPEDRKGVVELYQKARDATRTKEQLFRRSALHDLIEIDPKTDTFVESAGKVRQLLFTPGDEGALVEAMHIVGQNPVHKHALIKQMNSLYSERVLEGGRASRSAHTRFMAQYEGHYEALGVKDGGQFVRGARDMEALVAKSKVEADRVGKLIRRAYGPKLAGEDKYAGEIVRDMLADEMPLGSIANLKKGLLRTEAGKSMWQSMSDQGLRDIETRILAASGNEGSLSGLNSILRDSGDDRLQAVFGAKYVQGLKATRDLMQAMSRINLASPPATQLNTPTLQMMRTVFGPLSTAQRRVTALTRLNAEAANRRLADIVSNPEKLEAFVRLPKMSPASIGYYQAATAVLGFSMDELPEETRAIGQKVEEWKARGRPPVRGF